MVLTSGEESWVVSLSSPKIHFRSKNIPRNKEGEVIVTPESLQLKDIILNSFEPSNKASKYTKQKAKEMQQEIDKFTITVRDSNTLLSVTDREVEKKSVRT